MADNEKKKSTFNSVEVPKKIKYEVLPCNPEIPLQTRYPKELKARDLNRYLHTNVHPACMFTISKDRNNPSTSGQ